MALKAADFCVFGFNKSAVKGELRMDTNNKNTFGTDSWGPGMGSIYSRREIYEQYKQFLEALKKNNMVDPKKSDSYSIAIKISDTEIAKATILDFRDNKIYFKLTEYSGIPRYLSDIDDSLKWWKLEKLQHKIDNGVDKVTKVNENEYYVEFDDWDISWKIRLADINPGNISFNLLRGKDKFEEQYNKLLSTKPSDASINNLFFNNFTKPLHEKYLKKNGPPSGCKESRYFDKFKNEDGSIISVNLLDGILWDNKNTWHRSPFIKTVLDTTKEFERNFINIRIIKISESRPTPYKADNLDFSQFQNKYLKYKSKYLALKNQIKKYNKD